MLRFDVGSDDGRPNEPGEAGKDTICSSARRRRRGPEEAKPQRPRPGPGPPRLAPLSSHPPLPPSGLAGVLTL